VRVHPVLLDSRPAYLGNGATPTSLLLAPLGATSLLCHLHSRFDVLASRKLTVVPTFEADAHYERTLLAACRTVESVVPAEEFSGHLPGYEPSDWLLFVDPRCFPAGELDPSPLLDGIADGPRGARHLVALENNVAGTQECVEFDHEGRVRRIQRYYDSVTWTFTSGIACSLVPVSCTLLSPDLPYSSLMELRCALSSRGVPSRDLPLPRGVFDLTEETDLLSLNERVVLDLWSGVALRPNGCGNGRVGNRCSIHPTARLLGPVVLHDDVVIEEEATVVGPAVIGKGSRIGRSAMVAQCLVGPGIVIPSHATVRHRALFQPFEAYLPASGSAVPAPVYDPPGQHDEPEELQEERLRRSVYPRLKALSDTLLALLGLIVLSPLLAVIAVLIKLESRGPVLYYDKREGKGGRVFRCFKFRTMFEGAHDQQHDLMARNQVDGPQFKLDRDPRVTTTGRWLRNISFDELPQLVNVLIGEMSIVGPRPSPFRENQTCIPWREGRLSVRPGITGLWQVCRHERSSGDFHQWIYYDLLYVRQMSLWLDLKIMLATVVTLGGKGHVPLSWLISRRHLQAKS